MLFITFRSYILRKLLGLYETTEFISMTSKSQILKEKSVFCNSGVFEVI